VFIALARAFITCPLLFNFNTNVHDAGSMADVPKDLLQEIKRLEEMFIVPAEKLKEITTHFVSELEKGNNVLSERFPHQRHFLRVNPLAVMYISGHSVFSRRHVYLGNHMNVLYLQ
jgi:predicted transcriptional regulator